MLTPPAGAGPSPAAARALPLRPALSWLPRAAAGSWASTAAPTADAAGAATLNGRQWLLPPLPEQPSPLRRQWSSHCCGSGCAGVPLSGVSTGGSCQLPGLAAVADPTAAARLACPWRCYTVVAAAGSPPRLRLPFRGHVHRPVGQLPWRAASILVDSSCSLPRRDQRRYRPELGAAFVVAAYWRRCRWWVLPTPRVVVADRLQAVPPLPAASC